MPFDYRDWIYNPLAGPGSWQLLVFSAQILSIGKSEEEASAELDRIFADGWEPIGFDAGQLVLRRRVEVV